MKKSWIDDADSYICPICGFSTDNPNKYYYCRCPKCGFQAEQDKKRFKRTHSKWKIVSPLSNQVQCPKCGYKSDEMTNFCANCGKRIIKIY